MFLIVKGYCSATQWFKMLKSPSEGVKNAIIDRTLLRVPTNPHAMAAMDDFVPKKIFCVLKVFRCSMKQVFKLQAMDKL